VCCLVEVLVFHVPCSIFLHEHRLGPNGTWLPSRVVTPGWLPPRHWQPPGCSFPERCRRPGSAPAGDGDGECFRSQTLSITP